MDKLDRMLRALPDEPAAETLGASISQAVLRRHRRRQSIRRAGAAVLATLGIWLLWPGILWMSSNELYVSGTSWLMGGLDFLNYESMDALSRLWNGALSAQGAIGSTLAVSVLLGAGLLCCSIFLAVDRASWSNVSRWQRRAGSSTILTSGLHP
jgi:4-amino-4-deoxy-L-arabinose transferase-like glycosyltransferase